MLISCDNLSLSDYDEDVAAGRIVLSVKSSDDVGNKVPGIVPTFDTLPGN